MSKVIHLNWLRGMTNPSENRLKPLYLRTDYLGLLQLFKFVTSDSAFKTLKITWKLVYSTRAVHRKHCYGIVISLYSLSQFFPLTFFTHLSPSS